MFLTNATSLNLLDEAGRSVYEALNEGLYDLYFRYDKERETLSYYAFVKHDTPSLPPILVVRLSPEGPLQDSYDQDYPYASSYVRGFLSYLFLHEKELSPEDVKELYGSEYEELDRLSKLDPASYKAHRELRDAFLSLTDQMAAPSVSSIADQAKESQKGLATAVVSFSYYDEGRYAVTLSIYQDGKKLATPSTRPFLRKVLLDGTYFSRDRRVPTKKDEYEPPYGDVLALLAKNDEQLYQSDTNLYGYSASYYLVDDEAFIECLFLLEGHGVAIEGRVYQVPSPIEGYVSFDEDGQLLLSPSLPRKGTKCEIAGDKLAYWADGKMVLASFPSPNSASLYAFFLKHGKKAYLEVADLFPKRVVPKLGKDLLTAEKANGSKRTLSISLYVSLMDDQSLGFQTLYLLNHESVAPALFDEHPLGASLRQAYLEALKAAGGLENGTAEDPLPFLQADLTELGKLSDLHIDEALMGVKVVKSISLRVQGRYENDWLSLSMHANDFTSDELRAVFEACRKKKKFVLLDGKAVIMSDEVKKAAELAASFGLDESLENAELPLYDAFSLPARGEGFVDFQFDSKLGEALEAVASYKKSQVDLDPEIRSSMRDYQYEAVQWLTVLDRYGLSGILADDMGLGKTLETIAYISTLHDERPILVVSPKSLVYNWAVEFRRWFPSCCVETIDGPRKNREGVIAKIYPRSIPSVYLISYDTLRIDIDLLKDKKFALAVLDEGQFIKNSSTKKAHAAKGIEAARRLVLTGTPIENDVTDLWSIFDFLMPGYLGTESSFERSYIDDGPDSKMKKIELLVRPFILRRTKEDVLSSLPPKTTIQVPVEMEEDERALYESWLEKTRELVSGGEGPMALLKMLTRLRQICIDPSTFLEGMETVSSKLQLAIMMIENAVQNGHKALVFSSFVKVLDHLEALLAEKGICSMKITGQTDGKERIAIASSFNESGDTKVLLISLKAGGTGLNLQGADTVIHLDPWWNVAAEEQASDRAHRLGQLRPVTVYKLIDHDTVEEKVVALQEKKKSLYEAFIKSGEEGVSSLTVEDIKFILS